MAKDEEYHFKDAESPTSYTTGPAKIAADKDAQAKMKRRKIISMSIIFFVLWGAYKLITTFTSQSKKNPQPTTAAQVTAPKPRAQITKPTPVNTMPSASMQEVSAQKTRIDNLESQLVNLQSSLNDTTSKLNDLSTQISTLSEQLKPAQVTTVTKVKERPAPPPRIQKPPYRLQAAILGRAWLKRRDGSNVTVTIGDKIPGFGVVVFIDPNEGIVQTSTGAIIHASR